MYKANTKYYRAIKCKTRCISGISVLNWKKYTLYDIFVKEENLFFFILSNQHPESLSFWKMYSFRKIARGKCKQTDSNDNAKDFMSTVTSFWKPWEETLVISDSNKSLISSCNWWHVAFMPLRKSIIDNRVLGLGKFWSFVYGNSRIFVILYVDTCTYW